MSTERRGEGDEAGGEGQRRWLKVAVPVAAAVLLAGAAVGILLGWKAARERAEKASFEEEINDKWEAVRAASEGVVQSLSNLESRSDLGMLASSSSRVQETLGEVVKRARNAPASAKRLAGKSIAAASSLENYLELIQEMCSLDDQAEVESLEAALESRSLKARRELTDLLGASPKLQANINSDFFAAAEAITSAFRADGSQAEEAERQAVYETMRSVMEASIKAVEPQVVWPMVSSQLRTFLQAVGGSPEEFMRTWRTEWLKGEPTDYYLSPDSVEISDGYAVVKAIVYPDQGAPRIKSVRLVREPDGWKIDSYPY